MKPIQEFRFGKTPFRKLSPIRPAGHGKFQYVAFLTAGLIYFTSGMQSGINAYILPSVKCAYQLTDSQLGILNALFLGGESRYPAALASLSPLN